MIQAVRSSGRYRFEIEADGGKLLHYTGPDMHIVAVYQRGRQLDVREALGSFSVVSDAIDSRSRQPTETKLWAAAQQDQRLNPHENMGKEPTLAVEFVVVELVLHAACIRVRHSVHLFSTDFILFFADPGQCLEPSQQAEGRSGSAPKGAMVNLSEIEVVATFHNESIATL